MEREVLFKFFEGNASLDEESRIQTWVDTSEDNFLTFMRERNAYDILLMSDTNLNARRPKLFGISLLFRNVAASISLFILGAVTYYYITELSTTHSMNVVKVPSGQYLELILADSTKVWLNANAELMYPSDFSANNRTVSLKGEGYFEVSSNLKKPFFVQTDLGDVEVTGTIFNVLSNSNKSVFEVSLFEGGVKIYNEDVLVSKLIPNQKITLSNNKYFVSHIDKPESYLWREGILGFRNESIEKVFNRFEEAFEVKINVNPKYDFKYTFTGKFRKTDGLDYSLRLLQRSIPFKYDYDIETNTVFIE